MKTSYTIIVIIFLFFSVGRLYPVTNIVGGTWEYTYEVSSGDSALLDKFYQYKNSSNSQTVIKKEPGKITVLNKVNLSPFIDSAVFPIPLKNFGKDIEKYILPDSDLNANDITYLKNIVAKTTSGAKTQTEAVERLMIFIRQNVTYSLGVSSNPVSVLMSGSAYCEGYARAAVSLFRVAGIPAREVECYIAPGHFWGFGGNGGSGGFHAYVEVYFKSRGWISYDPQNSMHHVDPFHIVNFPRSGAFVKEISVDDKREYLDMYKEPSAWPEFYSRKTSEVQNSGIVTASLIDNRGKPVTASYKTNRWLFNYDRNKKSYPSITVLESGSWAIPEGTNTVYFMEKGGFFEHTITHNVKERLVKKYDMSDTKQTIRIKLPPGNQQLVYWRHLGESDKVVFIQADNGYVTLHLSDGQYLFSLNNNVVSPTYLIDVNPAKTGKEYSLTDFPFYLKKGFFAVIAGFKDEKGNGLGGVVLLENQEGSFYEYKGDEKKIFYAITENSNYNIISFRTAGYIMKQQIDFAKNKSNNLEFSFADDSVTELKFDARANIFISRKVGGNSFQTVCETYTAGDGKLLLKLPSGKYYISDGGFSWDRMRILEITDGKGKKLSFSSLPKN